MSEDVVWSTKAYPNPIWKLPQVFNCRYELPFLLQRVTRGDDTRHLPKLLKQHKKAQAFNSIPHTAARILLTYKLMPPLGSLETA